MNDVLDLISAGFVVGTALCATAFCVVYYRRPWRSRTGRTLMAAEASVAVLTGVSVLFRIVGTIPGAHLVQAIVLCGVFAAQVAMLALLRRARRT